MNCICRKFRHFLIAAFVSDFLAASFSDSFPDQSRHCFPLGVNLPDQPVKERSHRRMLPVAEKDGTYLPVPEIIPQESQNCINVLFLSCRLQKFLAVRCPLSLIMLSHDRINMICDRLYDIFKEIVLILKGSIQSSRSHACPGADPPEG